MKSFGFLLAVISVILVCCGFAFADPIGHITAFTGEASILRPNVGIIDAAIGVGMEIEDTLMTGPVGRMKVILADDKVINLGSDTKIMIQEFQIALDQRKRISKFKLEYGKARMLFSKLLGVQTVTHVETPSAIIGVTGTTFVVAFDKKKNFTTVLTFEGSVGVSSSNKSLSGVFPLLAGKTTTVYPNEFPSASKDASQHEKRSFFIATGVPESLDATKMPGRKRNIIDDPLKDMTGIGPSTARSKVLESGSGGEADTEFDAYIVPEREQGISEEDLPLPGDQPESPTDVSRPSDDEDDMEEETTSEVSVSVDFDDGEDSKKKK